MRDLAERVAERRLRIVRAILRFELRWIDLLQVVDRFERFFPGSVQGIVYGLIVNRFEAALYCRRTLARTNAEVRQIRNRQGGRLALHRAWHVLSHRDRAEQRFLRIRLRLQVAIQPTILGRLHARRR